MEKQVILDILKKSIHNLLKVHQNYTEDVLEDCHNTQSLCSAIEAMFLHGGINNSASGILSIFGRNKQSYEYDFWNFVVEYIPRDLIQIMERHDFKLTSIGLSRVWLRFTLNESTLMSYLESMIEDDKRLKQFYCKEALIRDEELMGAFCGLLKSIEHLIFNLNTSLPVLNTWLNSDALQIAGLQHHAFLKSNITTENLPSIDNINSDSSFADDNSLSIMLSNDEEILPTSILSTRLNNSISAPINLFLPNSYPGSVTSSPNPAHSLNEEIIMENDRGIIVTDNDFNVTEDTNDTQLNIDNGLLNHDTNIEKVFFIENISEKFDVSLHEVNFAQPISTEISDLTIIANDKVISNPNDELINDFEVETNVIDKENIENNKPEESFDQLWAEYNLDTIKLIEEVDVVKVDEILNHTNSESSKSETSQPNEMESSKESEDSWILVGDECPAKNTELKKLMDIFPGVTDSSAKLGENSVFGGLCHKCRLSLETNKVFLDYYDGQLYCFSCESKTKSVIPRDVILNWDFTAKSVSETSKKFLSEIMVHPNINLATNSCLFDVIPELCRVRSLRHKLSLLWLQVTSCDIETSSKVRKSMFPREYMLASVKEKDLYSLEDLIILQNGVLERTLLYVINKIAIPHVTKCLSCRMKALPCDKCWDENNSIYIHDIEYYRECSTRLCPSVIHNRCMVSAKKSFYCHRCVEYLENQQPITLDGFDTADFND